jgi:hypothetical protein
MEEAEGARFAEAEGIVSHLTSIVLVDEAAEAIAGVPATRKVPLADPATARIYRRRSIVADTVQEHVALQRMDSGSADYSAVEAACLRPPLSPPTGDVDAHLPHLSSWRGGSYADIKGLRGRIEWDLDSDAMIAGNLSHLPPSIAAALFRISSLAEVVELAKALERPPIVVAVALVAEVDKPGSRTAARIARTIFAKAEAKLLDAARKAVGL